MKLRRRLVSIPAVVLLWLAATPLLPLLLLLGLAVDSVRWLLTRSHFMATRLLVFGWVYLTAEVFGLVALFLAWLVPGDEIERSWRIQTQWAAVLLTAATKIFSLDIEVHGTDLLMKGQFVVLMRHVSIVDNLLPANLIAAPTGVRLRYVLKRELLGDPCIDVAGLRLPNQFVDRSGADSDSEIEAVGRLARGLPADQGILIYPEGTRFSRSKRDRALVKIAESSPELAERAAKLNHVLPPRLGGTVALLSSNLDVVVCTHTGLEGFATLADIWSGAMVARTVEVAFWRYPAADLPGDRDRVVDWLYGVWMDVDAWVAART